MSGPALGRYRSHARTARRRAVLLRYSEEEFSAIAEAAGYAGLTPSGYAAEAALAAARGVEAPSIAPLRSALVELMAARTQVRRFGVNVNQAVRQLNSTGEAPEWLAAAVAITNRAVGRLDEVAGDVAAATRRKPLPESSAEARSAP